MSTSRRPNVIVVDDDPAVCSSLKFALELEGFTVRTFPSGSELLATDLLAPDLTGAGCLVIDYQLPAMNGLELLARLRAQGHAMPAVLMTTAPDAALRRHVRAAGAALVEKPLLGNALLETIGGLVRDATAGGGGSPPSAA